MRDSIEKYYNKIDNKGVFSDNEIIKLRKILACPTENEQDIKFKEYLLAYKNEEMEIKKKKN